MTKHHTFPGEHSEMPLPDKKPEITQPHHPQQPEIPEEDPLREPDELPPNAVRPLNPGSLSWQMKIEAYNE